jgi:hypothetical protein
MELFRLGVVFATSFCWTVQLSRHMTWLLKSTRQQHRFSETRLHTRLTAWGLAIIQWSFARCVRISWTLFWQWAIASTACRGPEYILGLWDTRTSSAEDSKELTKDWLVWDRNWVCEGPREIHKGLERAHKMLDRAHEGLDRAREGLKGDREGLEWAHEGLEWAHEGPEGAHLGPKGLRRT